ncbi:hypothetical protein ACTA71_006115 [Dictyostelium dimigraforme]
MSIIYQQTLGFDKEQLIVSPSSPRHNTINSSKSSPPSQSSGNIKSNGPIRTSTTLAQFSGSSLPNTENSSPPSSSLISLHYHQQQNHNCIQRIQFVRDALFGVNCDGLLMVFILFNLVLYHQLEQDTGVIIPCIFGYVPSSSKNNIYAFSLGMSEIQTEGTKTSRYGHTAESIKPQNDELKIYPEIENLADIEVKVVELGRDIFSSSPYSKSYKDRSDSRSPKDRRERISSPKRTTTTVTA